MAKGFRAFHGRDPIAGRDYDPDAGMCEDDYNFMFSQGDYTDPGKRAHYEWVARTPIQESPVFFSSHDAEAWITEQGLDETPGLVITGTLVFLT